MSSTTDLNEPTNVGDKLRHKRENAMMAEEQLRQVVQLLRAENDTLRDQITILKTDFIDISKALRAEEREHASTAMLIQGLEGKVKVLKHCEESTKQQVNELKAEKKSIAAEKRSAVTNLNSSRGALEKERKAHVDVKEKLSGAQAELKSQEAKNEESEKKIRQLTTDNTRLEERGRERVTQVHQLTTENISLKEKVAILERNDKIKDVCINKTIRENLDLEKRLRICKPLVEVSAAVRRRYFERAKQDFTGGTCVDARGVADLEAIGAGPLAAHRANYAADIALLSLNYLEPERDASAFSDIYNICLSTTRFDFDLATRWAKRTEVMNMAATLLCFSRSNCTISPTEYPGRFLRLYNDYIHASSIASSSQENRDKMDQNPET
jgi:hypothetical protein